MTDTSDRIAGWLCANASRVGLPSGSEPQVSLIGTGESYAAWLVRTQGADPLLVRGSAASSRRVASPDDGRDDRPGSRAARPGTARRAVEESIEPLDVPFMVTGFVPGREVRAQDWDDALLLAHARQLAALHATPFALAGEVTAPEQNRTASRSLLARFAESLEWWRGAHPDVLGEPDVARLVPEVERHITEAEPTFSRLRRFALIHGDLVVPNILVDGDTPRYVDWEWVEIGDPAQDLAYIGGLVAAPPWYVPLTPERVDRFLNAYIAHAGETAGPVANLRARRDAFEVFERFISSLHFRTQRGNEEDQRSGRYTEAVRLLTTGLRAVLGRASR